MLILQLFRRSKQLLRFMPFTVTVLKQLGSDDPLLINQDRSGMRQPALKVQPVRLDRLAARIRENGKRDLVAVAELLENLDRVITDSDNLNAGFFE